jgi:hypothetical protein
MGHTIKVKITKDVPEGNDGVWKPDLQEIWIVPISRGITKSNQEQTFWHEAMHCIFDTLSYNKHNQNEVLVDRVAQCLYQIDQTKE